MSTEASLRPIGGETNHGSFGCPRRRCDRRGTRVRPGPGPGGGPARPGFLSVIASEVAGSTGIYIAVADDRALPAGTWHPGMSSRLGNCKIVHMAGSDEVMFTRPAELARTLIEAAHD